MSSALAAVFLSSFVALGDVSPAIEQEMRYAGADNFVGRPVAGYEAPKCLLTRAAAEALGSVQKDVEALGLGLKVYDCYRPQRAVDDFVAWAKDPKALKGRRKYYPRVDKKDLFAKGYIAETSGHSKGSTVDVTLAGLDMGTDWDLFDPRSHFASRDVPAQARANRLLLRSLMEKRGFKGLTEEWWHFTLSSQPFPSTWFDEPVR